MQRSRRALLKSALAMGVFASGRGLLAARAQQPGAPANAARVRSIDTSVLRIGFEESGSPQGFPIFLLHGFPDDVRAWDGVVPPLVDNGHRVLVPYLRGHGATRLRDAGAPKMAEQAAIGQDLIDFADALRLPRFAVAGYDWGNRAACIAAALHPDRVRAAVLIGGSTNQDTIAAPPPRSPGRQGAPPCLRCFNKGHGPLGLLATP